IAFGDFSYYWIIERSPIAVDALHEKYALQDQTGYFATEFLGGQLIRKDAVKVLEIME
ncbi:MAG: phage major capsid protein, partial [Clostridia bacterium]|nr:phage major capsid protein [Clostridia bacterium]